MKNQAPKPLVEYPKLRDWVSLNEENKLVFFSGRVELGQGNITALTMMICDELGVQPGQVNLQTARTDMTPNEGFTAGSMSIVASLPECNPIPLKLTFLARVFW